MEPATLRALRADRRRGGRPMPARRPRCRCAWWPVRFRRRAACCWRARSLGRRAARARRSPVARRRGRRGGRAAAADRLARRPPRWCSAGSARRRHAPGGTALVIAAAAIAMPLLLPRARHCCGRCRRWRRCSGAIGLGAAVHRRGRRSPPTVWRRAGLAAAGFSGSCSPRSLSGSTLLYGPADGDPARATWDGSLSARRLSTRSSPLVHLAACCPPCAGSRLRRAAADPGARPLLTLDLSSAARLGGRLVVALDSCDLVLDNSPTWAPRGAAAGAAWPSGGRRRGGAAPRRAAPGAARCSLG